MKIYVVTERQVENASTNVDVFKTHSEAVAHAESIVDEWGFEPEDVTRDGDNWYDTGVDTFDILITEAEI